MAGKSSTKAKLKKAEEAVAEEVNEDEDALEEIEGTDEETTAKAKKQDDVTFGASDLAKWLTEKTGKKVTPRELRTLIRKMARDGSGRVNREITAGNRTRYNWSGPNDPEVKAIIKAFKAGELEEDKQAKLAELKERKAKKKAEEGDKPKGKKGKGKGKKDPEPEAADDDELELDDDE